MPEEIVTIEEEATDPLEQDAPAQTWDSFIGEQSDDVQALFAANEKGLRSALDSERTNNRDISRQLKELGSKTEEGSELRASFDKLSADVAVSNSRADFFEAASDPTLGLRDARLAWVLISGDPDAFTRRGKIDFEGLKAAHPVLFEAPKQKQLNSQAGTGTRTPLPTKTVNEQMNEFMRS